LYDGDALTASKDPLPVKQSLMRLPEGAEFPARIARIASLKAETLEKAPEAGEVWNHFLNDVRTVFGTRRGIGIIHFARFEGPFLADLHQKFGDGKELPWVSLCTFQLSKRLLPGLPSYGIRAVSGHLGEFLEEKHQAAAHVLATSRIWSALKQSLNERNISTAEACDQWLKSSEKIVRDNKKRTFLIDRKTLHSFPDSPGVYQMETRDGTVLYIGKATSLKKRVSSYFKQKGNLRLGEMLAQVSIIKIRDRATPLEAALLESDQIKIHNPPYNSVLKREKRAIFFYSKDLMGSDPIPGEDFPYGPFLSNQTFESFKFLLKEISDDCFTAALKSMGLDWDRKVFPLRIALKFLSRFENLSDDEKETHALAFRALEEGSQTPENVSKSLFRSCARSAAKIKRAYWLCKLTDASIAFREEPTLPRRLLCIERGLIKSASYIGDSERIPTPKLWNRHKVHRQLAFDVATFDRLRVLWTELHQISKQTNGKGVEICLGPQKQLKLLSSRFVSPTESETVFDSLLHI
jgi:DNA polymerase III subunit epsilon